MLKAAKIKNNDSVTIKRRRNSVVKKTTTKKSISAIGLLAGTNESIAEANNSGTSKKRIFSIPIKTGAHKISPHVILGAQIKSSIDSQVVLSSKPKKKKIILTTVNYRPLFWVSELSVLSVVALFIWFCVELAIKVFRLPVISKQEEPLRDKLIKSIPAYNPVQKRKSNYFFATKKLFVNILLRAKEFKFKKNNYQVISKPQIIVSEPKFNVWNYFVPQLVRFSLICLLIVSPIWIFSDVASAEIIKGSITDSAFNGLQSFSAARDNVRGNNFSGAAKSFEEALKAFSRAEESINTLPLYLRLVAPVVSEGRQLREGEKLLNGAKAFARAGQKISETVALWQVGKLENNTSGEVSISDAQKLFETVLPDFQLAEREFSNVNYENLPSEYAESFKDVQLRLLPVLRDVIDQMGRLNGVLVDTLGYDTPKRYLFIFQNNYELRGSGGFMGSYALIDVKNGKIENIEMPGGGTYDLQGSLTALIEPPKPLQLINDRWEFQDANWWADWPTSAKKIQWFYERSGGSSVDGVIAFDTTFMESLLKLTGPIGLPKYKVTIDENNFVNETLTQVEVKYDRQENKPKQFLADLMPEMISRLTNKTSSDPLSIFDAVRRGLNEKHLLIYRNDTKTEKALYSLGWAGNITKLKPNADGLLVVYTNIAGQKTDGVMDNSVSHSVNVGADGAMTVDLDITRTHNGIKGDMFTGVRNVSYVRVYVPRGSIFVSATGFEQPNPEIFKTPIEGAVKDSDVGSLVSNERIDPSTGVTIYDEFDRTVFADWMMVDPSQSITAHIQYKLPWRMVIQKDVSWFPWAKYFVGANNYFNYSLFVDKQPGLNMVNFIHNFKSSEPLEVLESNQDVILDSSGWSWQKSLLSDEKIEINYNNKK